jgi:retron-type reverse transcriptase
MKRYGNLFDKIVDIDNLYLAHQSARKGKTWYKEVQYVDRTLNDRITELHTILSDGSYETSKYEIFERKCGTKLREIYKLPYYPDRIVHHAILQVILPILVNNLIADTYACVPGRGIHKCAKKIQGILRLNPEIKYCLKMDIRKFYPSIDHKILEGRVRRLIKCPRTLSLLDGIIESTDSGVPIGNYLSQHLANLYLSGFDHWLKEEKGIKHYFRYSDDLVILASDKPSLHILHKDVEKYLKEELKLEVKDNWQVFPIANRGIDFLGYRFYPGYTLLRKSIAIRFKRRMREILKGNMGAQAVLSSFVSYYGWMCHANTLNLRRRHITDGIKDKMIEASEELKCKNPIRKMVI